MRIWHIKASHLQQRVQAVENQLNRNGETLTDARVVEKILRTITDNFESIVCAIEESKDVTTLIVDELADSLEPHEQRKKKKKEETFEQALQICKTLEHSKNKYVEKIPCVFHKAYT